MSRVDAIKSLKLSDETIQVLQPFERVSVGSVGMNVIQDDIPDEGHPLAMTLHGPIGIAVGFSEAEMVYGKRQPIDGNGLSILKGSVRKGSLLGPFLPENSAPLSFLEEVGFSDHPIRLWCRNDVDIHSGC
jgi:hypothetical protein